MLTVTCPVCIAVVSDSGNKCISCGTSLEVYVSLCRTPDLLYNEAVDLFDKKEYCAAIEKLVIAHYLRPMDSGLILAMAKCAELDGSPLRAMEKLAILLADDNAVTTEAAQEFERLNGVWEQQQNEDNIQKELCSLAETRFETMKQIVKKSIAEGMSEMSLEGMQND